MEIKLIFKSYLNELINSQQIIQSNVDCQLQSINLLLNLDTAVPLGLIISEMITNSVKHAFNQTSNPQLEIFLSESNDSLELIFKITDAVYLMTLTSIRLVH